MWGFLVDLLANILDIALFASWRKKRKERKRKKRESGPKAECPGCGRFFPKPENSVEIYCPDCRKDLKITAAPEERTHPFQ